MYRPILGALFTAVVCVSPQAFALKLGGPIDGGTGPVIIGGGPGGGGYHPETFTPPNAPQTLAVTGRAPDSLSMLWYDRSSFEDGYRVYRQSGVTWVLVGEAPAGSGFMTYQDSSGLLPDTRYCYTVSPYNGNGQSSSPVSCAFTRDGKDNTVWRAELVVQTADVEDAGTDDSVFVLLNSAAGDTQPGGNRTWLDVTVQSPTLSRAWFAFLRRLTPPDGGEQRMLGAAPVLRLSQEIADHR